MTDQWIDDLAGDHGDSAPRAGFKDELRTTLSDGWHGRDADRAGNSTRRGWLFASAAAAIFVVVGFAAWTQRSDTSIVTPATDPVDQVTVPATTAVGNSVAPTSTAPSEGTVAPTSDVATSTAVPTTAAPTTAVPSTVPPIIEQADLLASWPEPPAEVAPIDDVPLLLPGQAVGNAGVPVLSEYGGGSAPWPIFTQVFVNAELDIVLTLQTSPGEVETTPAEIRRPTSIEGWDDAFFTDGSLRLVASDPSGFVRLFGEGADEQFASSLVETMQRRVDGVPGWQLDESMGLVEVNGAWNDAAAQRTLTWFEGTTVVAQMISSSGLTDLVAQALGQSFDKVDVNGVDAWISTTGGRRSIVWLPDGDTVVVLGVADDAIDPLAVARSVTATDLLAFEAGTTAQLPEGLGDGCSGSLFC